MPVMAQNQCAGMAQTTKQTTKCAVMGAGKIGRRLSKSIVL